MACYIDSFTFTYWNCDYNDYFLVADIFISMLYFVWHIS
jgi:hypothetical protein